MLLQAYVARSLPGGDRASEAIVTLLPLPRLDPGTAVSRFAAFGNAPVVRWLSPRMQGFSRTRDAAHGGRLLHLLSVSFFTHFWVV